MSIWSYFRRGAVAAKDATVSAAKAITVGVRSALSLTNPGAWASDHRAEAEKFTGWTYIAVHAMATQAMRADVQCYRDDQPGIGKARRKSLRVLYGSMSRFKALYGSEDRETNDLPPDHPLVRLLKRPNKSTSGAQFRYQRAQQLRLTGTALVWNVPGKGRNSGIAERYVIPTAIASAVGPSKELPRGGWRIQPTASRFTDVTIDSGFVEQFGLLAFVGQTIPAEQVQVTRLPHPTLLDDGQSPVSAGAIWSDTADMIDKARFFQMQNGADPSLLWTLPKDVDPSPEEMDATTKKINGKYAGPKNTGKVITAQHGTVVTPLSTAPKDMAYELGFKDSRDATLAIHNTPPVAVGLQEPGAYAAYFASMRAYRTIAVQPMLDLFAEDDTEFLAPHFGDGLTIEYEAEPIEDPDQEEKRLQTDISARAITVDELRALRGRPPLGGEEGKRMAGSTPTSEMRVSLQQPTGGNGVPETQSGADGLPQLLAANGGVPPVGEPAVKLPTTNGRSNHHTASRLSAAMKAATEVARRSATDEADREALRRYLAPLGIGSAEDN